MFKKSFGLLSKAKGFNQLSFSKVKLITPVVSLVNVQNANFSSLWGKTALKSQGLYSMPKFSFASLPSHTKMAMPALSPTMEQGNIIKWNFKEGDKIDVGDQICDIETDKATLGFEMQDSGYIAKILCPEGTKGVKVGAPIVILVDSQADVKSFADYKGEAAAPEAPAKQTITPQPEQKTPKQQTQQSQPSGGHEHHSENLKGVPRTNVLIRFPDRKGLGHGAHSAQTSAGGRVFASPFARLTARQKGIDISQVQGSGPNGRILKQDVDNYTPKPAPTTEAKTTKPAGAAQAKPAAPTAEYTEVPLSNVREIIAKRLSEAKATIPHAYLKTEIYIDDLTQLREQLNKESKSKISFNDIFIKASALASIEVPETNSQWHGTFVRRFKNVDVSIAVDTGSSLITPIIFAANKKGLGEIAATTKQLIEKAKSNTLKPQEFQGGTFGISNLGMLGVTKFSAVINPPQTCMLAIGKAQKKVIPDGEGFKEVSVLEVTLSMDHRVIDGAVGARWLQAFKNLLEKPHTMLL